jgi:hypothetical protein
MILFTSFIDMCPTKTQVCQQQQQPKAAASEPVQASNSSFFEGVEKLLEVWFTKQNGVTEGCDLRKIPR